MLARHCRYINSSPLIAAYFPNRPSANLPLIFSSFPFPSSFRPGDQILRRWSRRLTLLCLGLSLGFSDSTLSDACLLVCNQLKNESVLR